MNICSLGFLISCGVAAIIYRRLPSVRLRQFLFTLLNVTFVATFLPGVTAAAALAIWILGTYAALCLIIKIPSGRTVFCVLAATLSIFLVVKRYSFLNSIIPDTMWQHPVEFVGLSYMLFKFIHVLVDKWQGQLEQPTLACYAAYQLSFFTLLAGPIQRYQGFSLFWSRMDPTTDANQALHAWNRILSGMIKMGGLAAVAAYAFESADAAGWDGRPSKEMFLRFAVYLYAYPLFLYFNFSGYTDIAIGSAKLFGLALPENFNRPYTARSVIDFWNRWHITLTHWIRDYVFMTSYKFVAENLPSAGKYAGYILLFLSLVLAGAWHGSTTNFLLFGAMHGLGAMTNRIYADTLQSCLGRSGFQRYQKNYLVRILSVFMTLNFVCFSLLLFSPETRFANAVRTLFLGY